MSMIALFTNKQIMKSPVMYWSLWYETQRDGIDVKYRFGWKVWLKENQSYYNNGIKLRLYVNGVKNEVTVKGYQTNNYDWSYPATGSYATTAWYNVANKKSGSVPFYATLYDTDATKTIATSNTYNLTVPACMAYPTAVPDFTDEDNPTIKYTNPLGSSATKLEACISFDGSTSDIAYREIPKNGTSYTFNLTSAEREVLLNGTSGKNRQVRFYVKTYFADRDPLWTFNGLYSTFSVANGNPIFPENYLEYQDTNATTTAVTGNNKIIVQGKSNLKVIILSATPGKAGATIKSYQVTVDDITMTKEFTGSTIVDFGTINSAKDVPLSCTVTDSRGFKTTVKKTVTCKGYDVPSAEIHLYRENNYENGAHLIVNANFSKIGNNAVNIKFKRTWAGPYSYPHYEGQADLLTEIQDGVDFYEAAIDNLHAWKYIIYISDKFGSEWSSGEIYLNKGIFPLFIDTRMNAVGINGFPEEGESLRVYGKSNLLDIVTVDKLTDIILKAPIYGYNSNAQEAYLLFGRVAMLNLALTTKSAIAAGSYTVVADLPEALEPSANKILGAACGGSNARAYIRITKDSNESTTKRELIFFNSTAISSGAEINIFGTYITKEETI